MTQWVNRWECTPEETYGLQPCGTTCPDEILKTLELPYFLTDTLWKRGFSDDRVMMDYINSDLTSLTSIDDSKSVRLAAEIIVDHMATKKPIYVWGDYDADGVTSSVVVYSIMKKLYDDVVYVFLPNRHENGYGIDIRVFRDIPQERRGLVITVDNGVSEHDPISELKTLGYSVVVTDHHMPKETLPAADVIVNPKVDKQLFEHLAGVGVAYYTMCCVNYVAHERLSTPLVDVIPYLAFVSLGTIADMVPLIGDNRILARNGLTYLTDPKHPGIRALKVISGMDESRPVTAIDVSMTLAPRINAPGRMGDPTTIFKLLISEDRREIEELSKIIILANQERKAEEKIIMEEASIMVKDHPDGLALVLKSDDWHIGVTGIVAGRIAKKYKKPTILLSKGPDGNYRGTGRSRPGFNLHDCLSECQEYLIRYGGHKQAAGLTIAEEQIDNFRKAFLEKAENQRDKLIEEPIPVDRELSFYDLINPRVFQYLELMHPYGVGNPEPTFLSKDLMIERVSTFGIHADHVTLRLKEIETGIIVSVRAFDRGKEFSRSDVGSAIRMVYTADVSYFYNYPRLDIRLVEYERVI